MSQPTITPDENTHSFVIRLWQETPGQWRGTIRHVQGESRMAFTRLEQAMRWITRSIEADPTGTKDVAPSKPAPTGWFNWSRLAQTPTWVAAGVLAVVVLAVVLTNQLVPGTLTGTAVGDGGSLGGLSSFVAGLVVGGIAVALWVRSLPPR